jgi:hypothetical protein
VEQWSERAKCSADSTTTAPTTSGFLWRNRVLHVFRAKSNYCRFVESKHFGERRGNDVALVDLANWGSFYRADCDLGKAKRRRDMSDRSSARELHTARHKRDLYLGVD